MKPNRHLEQRERLKTARRIVIKVGSRVLVQGTGRPDRRRLRELVRQIALLTDQGRQIILVTSGAVGSGLEALGIKRRPTALPDLQAAAAIGQVRLMSLYNELFAEHHRTVSQVLLTYADLKDRRRHLNARNTFLKLLELGVVPIVNENDVVSVDEIKLGDNDVLASLVSVLIEADALLLMSVTDGFRAPNAKGRATRVPFLDNITENETRHATGSDSYLSVGGMATKLKAAAAAVKSGALAVIADGRKHGVIEDILGGKNRGTLIAPSGTLLQGLSRRKKWIALFPKTSGTIHVDAGASKAIREGGKSLLPIGIRKVEGNFSPGSLVLVASPEGHVFARGLSEYGSGDIARIMGRKTAEIAAILGSCDYEEVIHRDNLVLGEQ